MRDNLVIGRKPVHEALRAERKLERLWLAEGTAKGKLDDILTLARQNGVMWQMVPRKRLDQLAEGENHQGIIAEASQFVYAEMEEIFARAAKRDEEPFFLILDGIEDPHNLGSMIRTADAAGVHGVIIPKRRAAHVTAVVAKTSAGAVEHVPVVRVTNLNRTADELKERGVWLIASDAQAPQRLEDIDYRMPVAMVIGNEGRGISRLLKEKCDQTVRLTMKGKVSSLNASVAGALLMYEVLRSREHGRG
ncbi:23S rRNA (guanosine(2251)-2'-O)-methyltransferase RlmB [Mechercharimyces sp. CAU 1602]|uniref:23S rRNA (guanosine(2251)-2'-O)-methyltransferase RlmB n=1 Tax=Mechercharimyces sp. CAU 1602 TaxID=2973933 RepID=UPI0021627ED9|nr:23S rRNA (guanosine(2251)-2'-O)-methyltransferase RlmB [Mechercharimyces sp. CAU 1602]MCS1352515.1 23S rRNA (guanosine(2251)-2'-O)-methyltransferase RlmB [Mechercharimyces sp. CAU 1602]